MAKLQPRPPERSRLPEPGEYVLRVTVAPALEEEKRRGVDWDYIGRVTVETAREALEAALEDSAIDTSDLQRALIIALRRIGAEVARRRG